MAKGKYQSKRSSSILFILLGILFVLVVGEGILLLRKDDKPAAVTLPGTLDYTESTEKNRDSIAIPGYEALHLIADTTEQTLAFPNPSQNSCYFRISLSLEDGTLLWTSELVKPGQISEPVILKQALPAAIYQNAVLRYECFTMNKNQTPLNGAAAKLTLFVEER